MYKDRVHLHEEVDPYEIDPDVELALAKGSRVQHSPMEWKSSPLDSIMAKYQGKELRL